MYVDTFLHLKKLEPTVFFVQENDKLKQVVELTIENEGEAAEASLSVRIGSETCDICLGKIDPGEKVYRVHIPDIRQPQKVRFTLRVGEEVQDETSIDWTPERHWLIYVVQGSHHDLGYTDLPQNVLEEHNEFMDSVLRFCDETDDFPEGSKFKYKIEQSWSVLDYIRNRPKAVVDKLINLIKEGRIEVTALFGNEITALCGHEELIRLLYPSFRLKRKYGIPIKTAEIDDVPGLTWGLATVLAESGIKYFAPRLPGWSEVKPLGEGPKTYYWLGPDGSKVLFWHAERTWMVQDYDSTYELLPKSLAAFQEKAYPFDAVSFVVQGGHRDNAPPTVKYSYVAREWNSKWAYPKMIIATNADFFEYLGKKCKGETKIIRGELTDTDNGVGPTSTAFHTAVNRVAHDSLLSAEKFCTVAATITDYPYPYKYLNEAYDHTLLYDEHTWGMSGCSGPAQYEHCGEKGLHALKASALAQDALSKSLNKIVDQINLPKEGYHIIVFNPLSWKRTDIVNAYLMDPNPCGRPMYLSERHKPPILVSGTALGRDIIYPPLSLIEKPFDLVDEETGQKVPYQIVEVSSPQDPTPMAAHRYAMDGRPTKEVLSNQDPRHKKAIVFMAEDAPPMGYKTYRIVPSKKETKFTTSLVVTDTTLENRFYKITVDPKTGVVKSIFDKELGKELVDEKAPHGFNQFISRSLPTAEEHLPKESIVQKGKTGPVLGSIIIKGDGVGCPQRTQEITIYDKIKRIDLGNRLLKDSTPFLEIYFAYPFKIDNPKIKFEATDSVITPLDDQLPGSCTDYYIVQHWADVSDGSFGVTFSSVESHLLEFGGLWIPSVSTIHRGVTPPGHGHEFLKPGDLKKGHIYSYVMDNTYQTNFNPTQVGDVLFRYSVTTHRGDWKEGRARDFGWGIHTPLIPVFMEGKREGSLSTSQSFCEVDKPNVMLLNMKMAEDKEGIVIRLIETEGIETDATVTTPFITISEAYLTNLVEENKRMLSAEKNAVTAPIKAFGITTIRIKPHRSN